MEWHVVKTGAETFDALHAYGLGIVLAYVTRSPIELRNKGVVYVLQSPITTVPETEADILRQALALPTPEEVDAAAEKPKEASLSVTNLDGLLAATFTTRGVRVVSVVDALNKKRFRPSVIQKALKKANAAVTRLQSYTERKARHTCGKWLSEVLQDYGVENAQTPLPIDKGSAHIAVPMTLEPYFSYSTRRPISDGLITDKGNVTLRGTRYAAVLAFVGAARFLRAHRIAGDLVNFYVPIAAEMTFQPEISLPMLYPAEHSAEHAVVLRWLVYHKAYYLPSSRWNSLAYQVMQTQGVQQSISRDRGLLDYSWLTNLEKATGPAIVSYWRWLLGNRREQVPFETDHLVEALAGRRAASWLAHLGEMATHLHSYADKDTRFYSLRELKEVTAAMITPTDLPLSTVLEREQGTFRFGRALRLLGRQNPAPLKELVEELDAVRTRDRLIRVLAWAVQECTVAGANSEFIIVPDDEDLEYLLEDIEQHGAQSIAGLLILLSALYYPRRSDSASGDESTAPAEKLEGEKSNDH